MSKITHEQEVELSKKAYAKGYFNASLQEGATIEQTKVAAAKAIKYREELYSPETKEVMKKRAAAISETILAGVEA